MKQNIRWTLCSLFTVCSILAGCSHSESLSKQQDSELYKSMLGYYEHFKGFQTGSVYMTKSGELDSDFIFDYDICELDPIIIEYIDLYTAPDNVEDWDESEILSLVEDDSRLSSQDKDRLAYIIAGGYYAQDLINDDEEDSAEGLDAEESAACYATYQKSLKRASRRFLIGLGIALLEPTVAAEAAVLAMYAADLWEIEEDYRDCLDEAEEDLEDLEVDADENAYDETDDGSAEEAAIEEEDMTEDEDATEEETTIEEEDMTEDEDATEEETTIEEEDMTEDEDATGEEEVGKENKGEVGLE